jgi:hypothetical protein
MTAAKNTCKHCAILQARTVQDRSRFSSQKSNYLDYSKAHFRVLKGDYLLASILKLAETQVWFTAGYR